MKTYKQFLYEVVRENGYDLTWMEKFSSCGHVHRFTEMAAKRYAKQCAEYALNDAARYVSDDQKSLITGAEILYP